ncbi:MAG TPA: DUF5990 family protein [Pyrinomonadaceae bacterium]|nr:DUF5990 family protein [Pyrinomonadaceae bacterium]
MVLRPPASVELKVQRGRDELLPPTRNANGDLEFKFPVTVDTSAGSPNFLGKYAQGPKDARFIYVNSGTYAGQIHSGWGRRAKLSLVSVTREQVDHLLASPSAVLETTFNGTGSDGGPTCASVKGLVWTVVKE